MKISIILLVICFAVFAALAYKFKLYEKEYNPCKKSHKALICIGTGLCLVMSFIIFGLLSRKNLVYPFTGPIENYNAYEQLFDALMKHQLNLDVEVDSLFSLMNNPYDYSERKLLGVKYLWDRVLFSGKYYSYFGIAPIILIYFPFYFITGKVPTAQTVCFILTVISIVAIAFLVVKAQKLFSKRINLWLLFFSVIAIESGSLILMLQSSADMYYTATCSGIMCLSLFLLLSFNAYCSKKVKLKCLYFALSGISLVFLVMSRPNLALYFIILIPVYLSTLLSKEYTFSQKTVQIISFAVPVMIGAAFVMWYNYARFGSVFEFGAKYQLTVHDVSEYSITPLLFLPSLHYYFLQHAKYVDKFPFIKAQFTPLKSYSGYVYNTSTIGAFSFPSVWGLSCIPFSLSKQNSREKKSIFILGTISIFVVAFVDICLAGINIRYLADIMLIAVLFSTLMLVDFFNAFSQSSNKIKYPIFLFVSLLLILTAVIGFLLIFSNERSYIINLFNS